MDITVLIVLVVLVAAAAVGIWVREVIARGERRSAAEAAARAARKAALPPEKPAKPAKADDAETPAPHVIERQIVVVRCKFCQVLTPVDRDTCKECGAARFI